MSTKNTVKKETAKKATKPVKDATPKAPKPKKLTLAEAQEQLLIASAMIESLKETIALLNEQLDQERQVRQAYAGEKMMLEAKLEEEKAKGFWSRLFGG